MDLLAALAGWGLLVCLLNGLRKFCRWLAGLFRSLADFAQSATSPADHTANAYQVIRVIDGDTFDAEADCPDGYIRVKIAGIRSPEWQQPGGPEVFTYLVNLITQKTVILTCIDIDSYGRRVCDVTFNGDSLGNHLVTQGYAWAEPKYSRYCLAELSARHQRLGIWADAAKNPEV